MVTRIGLVSTTSAEQVEVDRGDEQLQHLRRACRRRSSNEPPPSAGDAQVDGVEQVDRRVEHGVQRRCWPRPGRSASTTVVSRLPSSLPSPAVGGDGDGDRAGLHLQAEQVEVERRQDRPWPAAVRSARRGRRSRRRPASARRPELERAGVGRAGRGGLPQLQRAVAGWKTPMPSRPSPFQSPTTATPPRSAELERAGVGSPAVGRLPQCPARWHSLNDADAVAAVAVPVADDTAARRRSPNWNVPGVGQARATRRSAASM